MKLENKTIRLTFDNNNESLLSIVLSFLLLSLVQRANIISLDLYRICQGVGIKNMVWVEVGQFLGAT